MQPIALDLNLVKYLIDNWGDYRNTQREFHKMIENLERFHSIPVDQNDGESKWLKGFKEIIESISDQNTKKMIADLMGPRNLKYFPAKLKANSELLEILSNSTPDKIGLELKNRIEGIRRYYSINSFNSTEYPPECRLFRVPKTINFKPGHIMEDISWLLPFIRDAKKIEFCDLFLMKNQQFNDDATFVKLVVGSIPNIQEVMIHCIPNHTNSLQKKTLEELRNIKPGQLKVEIKSYNPPTRDKNHDRFIIVDTNRISVKFTTSFNNLRKVKNGKFRVEDAFSVIFSSGRKYYD